MNRLTLLATAAAALMAAPALAQAPAAQAAAAPPAITAGMAITDTKGGSVGTIEAVSGDLATINTGSNKVQVPTSSFAANNGGLLFGMSKAELDAAASGAAAESKAKLATALTGGTKVWGPQGGEVGTIEAADAQYVTVATTAGKVRLPVSAFAMGEKGPTIAMTPAEVEAAAKGGAAPGGN